MAQHLARLVFREFVRTSRSFTGVLDSSLDLVGFQVCHRPLCLISWSAVLFINAKRIYPISLNTVNMSGKKEKESLSESKTENETTKPQQGKSQESSSATPVRYATRGNILTEQQRHVQSRKDEIMSLSISKKRKLYRCKDKYTELSDVQTWPEYFNDELANDSPTLTWWKRNQKNVVSEMNEDLNIKISLFRGDITTLEIDAIVNAANESLLGGGGVDGAIHRAAGIDLLHECELLNGCKPGDAKISCGYKLPAKCVIHTVGPRGEMPEVLASCYKTSLDLVRDNELKSVAFPCISTGIFGYPNLNAAKVALKTIRDWLETEEYAPKIERILFCLFLEKDVEIYNEQMQLFFPLDREVCTEKSAKTD